MSGSDNGVRLRLPRHAVRAALLERRKTRFMVAPSPTQRALVAKLPAPLETGSASGRTGTRRNRAARSGRIGANVESQRYPKKCRQARRSAYGSEGHLRPFACACCVSRMDGGGLRIVARYMRNHGKRNRAGIPAGPNPPGISTGRARIVLPSQPADADFDPSAS